MRNNLLACLLFPLVAGLSLSLNASAVEPAATEMKVQQTTASTKAVQSAAVNLNSADAPLLQRELNGIGKAKAEAIVAYREANGPFTSVDELLEIKGIGKSLLERNRDKLMVE